MVSPTFRRTSEHRSSSSLRPRDPIFIFFIYFEKHYTRFVCPRSLRAFGAPVLIYAPLWLPNEDYEVSVVFLPQIFQSHRSTGFPQILCTRIVTHIPNPSLSSCRISKRMGTFTSFPRGSALINAEPLLIPSFQLEVVGSCSGNSSDSTWVHKAGLSSFSIRYLCQSSDNFFHTKLSKSERSSSYCHSLAFVEVSMQAPCSAFISSRRPFRLQRTVCSPSVA